MSVWRPGRIGLCIGGQGRALGNLATLFGGRGWPLGNPASHFGGRGGQVAGWTARAVGGRGGQQGGEAARAFGGRGCMPGLCQWRAGLGTEAGWTPNGGRRLDLGLRSVVEDDANKHVVDGVSADGHAESSDLEEPGKIHPRQHSE